MMHDDERSRLAQRWEIIYCVLQYIAIVYCVLCIVYCVAAIVCMVCVLGDPWAPILLQYIISHLWATGS
jgi:hypothetical protein